VNVGKGSPGASQIDAAVHKLRSGVCFND
jgi:hypothetical protein